MMFFMILFLLYLFFKGGHLSPTVRANFAPAQVRSAAIRAAQIRTRKRYDERKRSDYDTQAS